MMKTNVGFLGLVLSSVTWTHALAVEVKPSGEIQAQASLYQPKLDDKESSWALEMPETIVGVTVYEQLDDGSVITGVVDGELAVTATDDDSDLSLRQAYLSWNLSTYTVSGGRLETLEQSYIINYSRYLESQARGGLQAAKSTEMAESEALRFTAQSGEYLTFASQIVLDPDKSDNTWGLAAIANTQEGTISLTYRRVPDESALWGNQISWVSGNVTLSGAYMVQDEVLGYDLDIRMRSAQSEGFLGFSRDLVDEEIRWQVGFHQQLSNAVTSYSELLWWPDDSQWLWSTGFELSF